MQRYVNDANTVIGLDGIRYVEKVDRIMGRSSFYLRVAYKGQSLEVEYKDEAGRNAMFDMLASKLTGGELKGVSNG